MTPGKRQSITAQVAGGNDLLVEDFLQHLKLERGLSANTVSAYRTDIAEFIIQGKIADLRKTGPAVVAAYVSGLSRKGRKPTTVARKVSAIRHLFDFLKESGKIKKSPIASYPAPRLARYHPDYLSPAEIESIIKTADPSSPDGCRDRAILEVLYGCGLRISELINLSQSDLEMEAGFIRVHGKGSKQRLVPLGQMARLAVQKYIDGARPSHSDAVALFLGRTRSRFSRVGMWKLIGRMVRRAGITKKVTPHTFRHSFATHLLEGGADLRIVQEMLGHADITTTEIYTRIDRDYIIAEHRKHHPRELAGFKRR